jgi:DNA-binding transcriptional regulator GbsR (MarR family)
MSDEVLEWVDRVAAFLAEQYGQPPIAGRILGWLMICDPPEQSATQICTAIGASRASLTSNIRLLVGAGLVSKRAGRGERTTYFRMEDDAWERVIRQRVASLASFRRLASAGLELAGPDKARLRDADRAFGWMAGVFERAKGPGHG